jgi:HTH-type transcriptional regulator, glycine betaine synthesis regulator
MPAIVHHLHCAAAFIRRSGRDREVVAFETSVIAFFLEAADILGIPRSLATIYGICFSSPVPLSFAEIGERLDISKGSISQGLRVLRGVGALKEVSIETERVERFEPDIELRKLFLHYIENRVEKQLEAGEKQICKIKSTVPRGSVGSRKLAARIQVLDGWHAKSRALLPLVKVALELT